MLEDKRIAKVTKTKQRLVTLSVRLTFSIPADTNEWHSLATHDLTCELLRIGDLKRHGVNNRTIETIPGAVLMSVQTEDENEEEEPEA